jgi:hypothetical protein
MYRIEDSSNVDIKNRLGFFIPVIGDFSESGFNCDPGVGDHQIERMGRMNSVNPLLHFWSIRDIDQAGRNCGAAFATRCSDSVKPLGVAPTQCEMNAWRCVF